MVLRPNDSFFKPTYSFILKYINIKTKAITGAKNIISDLRKYIKICVDHPIQFFEMV